MNELTIFDNPQFGEIRIVSIDGQPWFIAADVCRALEIVNSRDATERLDDDEKNTVVLNDGTPGNPNKTVVNEAGLYALILGSRKLEAKAFKRWITHDVIPSIRKNGAYMTPETIEKTLNDPDFIIGLASKLKEEQAARRALEEQRREDAPKLFFADAISGSTTNILVRDMAKLLTQNGYKTGGNRFYERLRKDGYLINGGSDYNMPTQNAMEMGLFFVKETPRISKDGVVIDRVAKITPKGQKYFLNRYLRGSTRGGNVQ